LKDLHNTWVVVTIAMHRHWKWNMKLIHKKVHIEVEAWLLTCSKKKNLWYLSHINIHIKGWLGMDTRGRERAWTLGWRNIKLVISHDIRLVWYSTKTFGIQYGGIMISMGIFEFCHHISMVFGTIMDTKRWPIY